jgi:hypothetical protein
VQVAQDGSLEDYASQHWLLCYRELEKKEKEKKEKDREEKKRQERRNRDAFKDLLKAHREDGTIVPKMRWKVIHFCLTVLSFDYLMSIVLLHFYHL